jgi:hypothetical protein
MLKAGRLFNMGCINEDPVHFVIFQRVESSDLAFFQYEVKTEKEPSNAGAIDKVWVFLPFFKRIETDCSNQFAAKRGCRKMEVNLLI